MEPQSDVYQIPDQIIRPLKSGDPKIAVYHRAADTAEAFLRFQARTGKTDWRTPIEKYLDIMCLASLGEHAKTVAAIDSFLSEYPEYVRHRSDTATAYDHPVRGPLIQLRLYSLARLLIPDSPDASTTPDHPGEEALPNPTLRPIRLPTQQKPVPSQPLGLSAVLGHESVLEFLKAATDQAAVAMTEQAASYERKDMDAFMADCSQQPDELRAKALPDTLVTIVALHEKLLPEALGTAGAKAVRDYLRSMATIRISDINGPQKPFFGYANRKLQSIDHDILAQYQGEAEKSISQKRWDDARKCLMLVITEYAGSDAANKAKIRMDYVTISEYQDNASVLLAQFRFEDARALFRKIIQQFPNTAASEKATEDLKNSVPLAVKYYRDQGDTYYHPEAKSQFGVAQVKATGYYEKMYKEDPAGPQSDYALLMWSRGLASSGKCNQAIEQLKLQIQQFPNSQFNAQATYLIGFYSADLPLAHIDEGIDWFKKVETQYPDSEWAPEALWYTAFLLAYGKHKANDALPYLEDLKTKHPNSPRISQLPGIETYIQQLIDSRRGN